MYAGVPRSADTGATRTDPASPKSEIRTRPSLPTSMLPGLTSPWNRPAACTAASPSPAAANALATSRTVRGEASHAVIVAPSTSSIAT